MTESSVSGPPHRNSIVWLLMACFIFPIVMCGWKLGVDILFTLVSFSLFVWETGIWNPDDIMDAIRGDILGFAFFVSIGGLVFGAWCTSKLLKWPTESSFALGRPSVIILALATVSGLFVGTFPGWIAQVITETFPALANQGALELVKKMLIDGPLWSRIISISAVCLGAPILEELIFRGFLWSLIERTVQGFRKIFTTPNVEVSPTIGSWLALVITSIGFAAFHMDPVQSTALLFTAFTLGWLRIVSGSIWPCIALHFINNTLATVMAILWFDTIEGSANLGEEQLGFQMAVMFGLLSIVLSAACWPFRRWRSQ